MDHPVSSTTRPTFVRRCNKSEVHDRRGDSCEETTKPRFFWNGLRGRVRCPTKHQVWRLVVMVVLNVWMMLFLLKGMTFWKKCLHHALIFAISSMMNEKDIRKRANLFPFVIPFQSQTVPFFNKDCWFPQRAFVRRLYYDIFRLFFGRGFGQRKIMHSSPLSYRSKISMALFFGGTKKGSFSPIAGY